MARRLARRKATLTCQRGRGDLAIGGLYSEGIYSLARGSAIQRSIGYRGGIRLIAFEDVILFSSG